MAYPKSRDAYPRAIEMIVNGLAKRTQLPLSERKEGDHIFKHKCDDETEAKAYRYAIYGWIQLLLSKGNEEERETARFAQKWKIATEGPYLICKERESAASIRSVMGSLIEQGMM